MFREPRPGLTQDLLRTRFWAKLRTVKILAWLEIKGVVAVLAAGDLPLTHNLMPAAVNAVLAALERREQRVSRGHSRGL